MKKMLFFASLTLVLSLNAFGANSHQSDSTKHETVGNGWKESTSVMPKKIVTEPSQKTVNASKVENLIEQSSNKSNNESGSKDATQSKESKSDKSQPNSGSKPSPSNKSGSSYGSSPNSGNKSGAGSDNKSGAGSGNKSGSGSGSAPANKSENCKSTQCEQEKILNSPKPNK